MSGLSLLSRLTKRCNLQSSEVSDFLTVVLELRLSAAENCERLRILNCSVSKCPWSLFFLLKIKSLHSELFTLRVLTSCDKQFGFRGERGFQTLDTYYLLKVVSCFRLFFRQTGALGFWLQPLCIKISNLNWHSTILSVFPLWNEP